MLATGWKMFEIFPVEFPWQSSWVHIVRYALHNHQSSFLFSTPLRILVQTLWSIYTLEILTFCTTQKVHIHHKNRMNWLEPDSFLPIWSHCAEISLVNPLMLNLDMKVLSFYLHKRNTTTNLHLAESYMDLEENASTGRDFVKVSAICWWLGMCFTSRAPNTTLSLT